MHCTIIIMIMFIHYTFFLVFFNFFQGVPPGLPFQVGYREAGQEYTLYLLAAREQDRVEWIRAIRAGEESSCLLYTYYIYMYIPPTLFNIKSAALPTYPRPPTFSLRASQKRGEKASFIFSIPCWRKIKILDNHWRNVFVLVYIGTVLIPANWKLRGERLECLDYN